MKPDERIKITGRLGDEYPSFRTKGMDRCDILLVLEAYTIAPTWAEVERDFGYEATVEIASMVAEGAVKISQHEGVERLRADSATLERLTGLYPKENA